ncbi:hypothetical protein ISF_02582 [Cordyceps fumosorosea ARSEF 2679]|uniref:Uncharacterized protein n=1 Tax=Cordyceps fumosorosea (strain ARSEF 2679) TaxID=1081104 RepID=A0A168BVT0_CORFA|nr:hypothetical protein ISF_02582 [Cordyceps fumosorosea ARSEF 2679]OAA70608.1 hypothetical protein ISF_02582 [Cordyceps fumosorosea ARSEF 2679]
MPPRHTAHHTTKSATAARKRSTPSLSSSSGSSSSSRSPSPLPLSKQVRALERAHASVQQVLASQADRSSTLARRVEELTDELEPAGAGGQVGAGTGRRGAPRATRPRKALESRIHRCAARIAYDMFEGEEERATLLEILRRCRETFHGVRGRRLGRVLPRRGRKTATKRWLWRARPDASRSCR